MGELVIAVAVFFVLLFLVLSAGAFWLGVYDRGRQRMEQQR